MYIVEDIDYENFRFYIVKKYLLYFRNFIIVFIYKLYLLINHVSKILIEKLLLNFFSIFYFFDLNNEKNSPFLLKISYHSFKILILHQNLNLKIFNLCN